MSVLIWSPLSWGLLTGQYSGGRHTPLSPGRQKWGPRHMTDPDKYAAVEKLLTVADDAGLSLAHLALAFVLAHPAVTSAIIGPRTMTQLDDLLAGAEHSLSDDPRRDRQHRPARHRHRRHGREVPPAVAPDTGTAPTACWGAGHHLAAGGTRAGGNSDGRATYRWDVEFLHVPGLLQTEDYARALFSSRIPELPSPDLERRVQHRMQRRAIPDRAQPTSYETLIHEAALRMMVGSRDDARAQMLRVLELSEADHIVVRVIPFGLEHFIDVGAAMVYAGGAVPKLDTVVRDGPHGTVFVDSEAQLAVFRTHFRRMEAVSLAPGRSREFIHKLSKEL
ncbi:Scr1 family TA system antitoxin-like transcriptional regulator [Streptomyces olivaceus]|uniref:Scr1 family TA system antitoxin-like transcriptional regulator n=1 Tax=Streptomyces olivaceus TaxID=47716 RepID=UPI00369E315E